MYVQAEGSFEKRRSEAHSYYYCYQHVAVRSLCLVDTCLALGFSVRCMMAL